jgi:hypothetical protein
MTKNNDYRARANPATPNAPIILTAMPPVGTGALAAAIAVLLDVTTAADVFAESAPASICEFTTER